MQHKRNGNFSVTPTGDLTASLCRSSRGVNAQTLAKMPYIFNGDRTAASAKCYII